MNPTLIPILISVANIITALLKTKKHRTRPGETTEGRGESGVRCFIQANAMSWNPHLTLTRKCEPMVSYCIMEKSQCIWGLIKKWGSTHTHEIQHTHTHTHIHTHTHTHTHINISIIPDAPIKLDFLWSNLQIESPQLKTSTTLKTLAHLLLKCAPTVWDPFTLVLATPTLAIVYLSINHWLPPFSFFSWTEPDWKWTSRSSGQHTNS